MAFIVLSQIQFGEHHMLVLNTDHIIGLRKSGEGTSVLTTGAGDDKPHYFPVVEPIEEVLAAINANK